MSEGENPFFNDPARMRVNYQAAAQPADGSPPRYGNAVAPGSTAFHTVSTNDLPLRYNMPSDDMSRSNASFEPTTRLQSVSIALRSITSIESTITVPKLAY